MPARTKHQDIKEIQKSSGKSMQSSRHVDESGKDEKVRNLDTMLAQLCILDNTLEKKKSSKKEKKKKQRKIGTIYDSINDTKANRWSEEVQHNSNKATGKTNEANYTRRHVAAFHLLNAKDEESDSHKVSPAMKVQNQVVALGSASKALAEERRYEGSCLVNPSFGDTYEKRDVKKNKDFSRISPTDAFKLQKQSSLTLADQHDILNKPTHPVDVAVKINHKQERQFRKKSPKFNDECGEYAFRRKVSTISFASSNDSEKQMSKKESDNFMTSQACGNSHFEYHDGDCTIEDKMKLNISNRGYHYGEAQKDYMTENVHVSNANFTSNGSSKHECNDITDLRTDDISNDWTTNTDSPGSQSKSSGTADVSRAADEIESFNSNVMLGSLTHTRPTDNKAESDDRVRLKDASQPLCRVINVKPVSVKKSKKHKTKQRDSVDETHFLKKLSSFKESVKTNVRKSDKRKDQNSKEKRKNKHEVSESQKSGDKVRSSDTTASTDKSTRRGSRNGDRGILERNSEGYYYPSSNIQKVNGHCHKRREEKGKKKQAALVEDQSRSHSKNNIQLDKINPALKSGKGQVIDDNDSTKKSDLKQSRQRKLPEISEKSYSKKTSENDLRPTTRRPTEICIDSKEKSFPKQSKSKLKVSDDETTVAYTTEKGAKSDKTRNSRHDKPREVPKGSRMSDTLDWHTAVHDVSGAVRPDLRESKSKYQQGERYSRRQKTDDPPQRALRTSVSTDSASSYYSSEVASESSASCGIQSSSDLIPTERGGSRKQDRYNNNPKGGSSSFESTGWPEVKIPNNTTARGFARPRHQRSASSTSSFQRHEIEMDETKRKQKQKQKANADTSNAKRYENAPSSSRKPENEGASPTPSPGDKLVEIKFGKRRTRPPNGSIVAEGEGVHTTWQHQLLVLVSQKPEAPTGRKTIQQKFNQTKSPGNLLKKPATNSYNPAGDKRSLTIRHLYSLHNVLSDTQNGTVISGYRRSDRMRVAIKRISKPGTKRWGWLGKKVVPLELSLLCQVNETRCSGVIGIVEWHETSEAFLLVMVRPHPTVDLYDYVNKHRSLKETVARYIIQQLVTALQHCINCGVLHRDVKLENILLNPDTMEITLIDFGCGDYVRSGPYTEFAGTPEYYPPEWFSRKQYNGEPMTAWSVGVLLYTLLCGSLPFRSAKDIREKEANKFPADVSRGARNLVASLLQKNPKERLTLNSISSHPWLSKTDFRASKNASS